MSSLRILFLHPKTLVDSWPFPVDTLGEVVKAPSAVYPVLAAAIRDLPVQLEIFDGYVMRESFARYKRRLARPDLIAISVMSPLKALDTELNIRLARHLNPRARIVLGGNHATSFAERWVEEVGVDFVITGEGEVPFRALVEHLIAARGEDELGAIPNLVYRSAGAAKRSEARAPMLDLDKAPLPAWDLMPLERYGLGTGASGSCAALEMSRGCPHRCDFCNINTFWNYKQRTKSPERMLEELEQLHRLGVREFIFTDDNFAQDQRRVTHLLEELARRDLGFRFGAFVRGDTVSRNPDFAALAARAGLRFCLIGIETLEPEWLQAHRKGVRAASAVDFYSDVYRKLNARGIFVVGLFITPPEMGDGYVSGRGADGVVCDFHYTADLVAQKGSVLHEQLDQLGSVAKDMFYHDWNLTSIRLATGSQVTHKTLKHAFSSYRRGFALRSMLGADHFRRRFWWRHVGIVAERVVCSTVADVKRRRIARDTRKTPQERQDAIVRSVLAPSHIERLARSRRWRAPLALRNGLWSPSHDPTA